MAINVWSYLEDYEEEKDEIQEAISQVLSSGRLILGPKVRQFEAEFAKLSGAEFGVGVNSGTDALFLALKALGIESGDEVITVSNTAVPTVSAIVSTGAKPVFVDIDPLTYLMDVRWLELKISDRTKAILPVHLYGQCVDMNPLREIAAKHGLAVLEDCAQATCASYQGETAGSLGDIAAFSFYPTKILGAFGDGGLITVKDEKLAEICKRLRFYGMEKQYYSLEHGYNSRLDELQASILLVKLKRLDYYIKRRVEIAEYYQELLSETSLILPQTTDLGSHVYYLYVCRHPERDRILSELRKQDINLSISYPWPIHLMDAYQNLDYREGSLPETEKAAKEIFSLPMYPALTRAKQEQVCQMLIKTLQK